jgi:hypothetical protein
MSVSPTVDDFPYDVFVSYRHVEPEATWVRRTLIPRLEENNLRVLVDYRDFRLSRAILKEMERGVEQSCYTLCVLSPAYLDSGFAELENLMADHLGYEKKERRMLAIMREPCKPRLGMRIRLWLDMTNDEKFETNVERLIAELKQPPDSP